MALSAFHQCFWCVQLCKDEPYGGRATAGGGRQTAEASHNSDICCFNAANAGCSLGEESAANWPPRWTSICVCVKGTLVSVLFYFNRDYLQPLWNPASISDISQEVDCCRRSETSDMPVQALTHPQVIAVFRRCGVGDGSPSLVSWVGFAFC